MSHKPEKTLKQLFAHPIAMNLKWKDVIHLFESLGAELEQTHGGREKIKLNGHEHTFSVPHTKTLDSKDQLMQIRHFLEECGVTPEDGDA